MEDKLNYEMVPSLRIKYLTHFMSNIVPLSSSLK